MHPTPTHLSLLTPLFAGLALTVVNPLCAQSNPSAYTDPVGAMVVQVPAGPSVLSSPFLNSKIFQGPVVAVSGTSVTLSSVPTLSGPHFLHVLSGNALGAVATISSSTSPSVVLENSIAGLAVGDSVAIVPHVTLGALFSTATLSDGDGATVFNTDRTTKALTYFEGFGWYDENFEAADDLILYPGEGIVVNLVAATELVVSGAVSVAPVKFEFGSLARAAVGSINPVAGISLAQLFGNSLADGDGISVFQNASGTLTNVGNFTFFEGFGFYDNAFELQDDFQVTPLNAAILMSGQNGAITIPAAFTPAN